MNYIIMGGTGFSGSGLLIDILTKEYDFVVLENLRLGEFSIHHDEFSIIKQFYSPIKNYRNIFRYFVILNLSIFRSLVLYYPLKFINSILKKMGLSINKQTGFLSNGINRSHGIEYSIKSSILNLLILMLNFFKFDNLKKEKIIRLWFNLKIGHRHERESVIFDKSTPDNLKGAQLLSELIKHKSIFLIRNPINQFIQFRIANQIIIEEDINDELQKNLNSILFSIERVSEIFNSYINLIIVDFDLFLYHEEYRRIVIRFILGYESPFHYDLSESIVNNELLVKVNKSLRINKHNLDMLKGINFLQVRLVSDSLNRMGFDEAFIKG